MRIRYDIAIEDVVAFQRHRLLNSPAFVKDQRRMYIVLPLVIFVTTAFYAWIQQSLFLLIGGAVGAAIVGVMLAQKGPSAYLDALEKQTRTVFAEGENKVVFGPRELEITDEYAIERSAFHEHIVRWSAVEKVVVVWNYGFIHWCGPGAYIVPRKAIANEEFRAFFDAATHAWKASRKSDVDSLAIDPSRSPADAESR